MDGLTEIIFSTMTDQRLIGAVLSTMGIIVLGFFLRKKNILSADAGRWLAQVVLQCSMPALAFGSFMMDIDMNTLKTGANVLVWSFLIYILMIVVTPLIYRRYPADTSVTLQIITIFGSTAFFGIPIANAVWGPEGVIYAMFFNVANGIFIYSYGYIRMSGKSFEGGPKAIFKVAFMNPVMVAVVLGLAVWVLQDVMPQVSITDAAGNTRDYGILRIDKTAPYLFQPISFLMSLASPLAWLSIGITLGNISLGDALRNRTSWIYTIIKVILFPLATVVILLVCTAIGILPVDPAAFGLIVIMMMTPTATVAASYAISFQRDATLASNGSFLSTVAAVLTLPCWIIFIEILGKLPVFN